MHTFKFLLGGTLVAALLLIPAQVAATPAPFEFPAQASQYWMTAQPGTVTGASGSVLLLAPVLPTGSSAANEPLIPILEQLGLGRHEVAWFAATPWNATRELVGDVRADLYFFLNVQATTRLHVQLDDVAPDGTLTELGHQDHKLSAQHILPQHLTLQMPLTGAHLQKGHTLRLLVSVDDVDVLTWLQYDSSSSPSGVSFTHRLLDTDHDGIPDDHDTCPTEPDCDHDGQVDGGQTVNNGGPVNNGGAINNGGNETGPITYYQYYLDGGQTPLPFPPEGPPAAAEGRKNLELVGGGALGISGLLVVLGGLFGRHPL